MAIKLVLKTFLKETYRLKRKTNLTMRPQPSGSPYISITSITQVYLGVKQEKCANTSHILSTHICFWANACPRK